MHMSFRKRLWITVTSIPCGVVVWDHVLSVGFLTPQVNPTNTNTDPQDQPNALVLWRKDYTFMMKAPQQGDIVLIKSPFHCDQVQPLRLKEIQDGSQCDLGNGKVWVEADKITHTTEHSPPTLYNPGFGSVPQGLLKGVAVAVLWPPEKWSLMQRKDDD